jgi:hypothetical protein
MNLLSMLLFAYPSQVVNIMSNYRSHDCATESVVFLLLRRMKLLQKATIYTNQLIYFLVARKLAVTAEYFIRNF